MVDDKYIELMNLSLDNSLSADQKAALDEYLSNHPDAREYFEGLSRAASWLLQIPGADPPPNVKHNVMAAIHKITPITKKRSSLWSWVRDVLQIRIAWRYAYAFAAGVLCGIAVLAVSLHGPESSTSVDTSLATGTMVLSRSIVEFAPVDSTSFQFGSIGGTLETKALDNQVVLRIDVVSRIEITIEVIFDLDDLSFTGLWQKEHFQGSVVLTDSVVTLKQPGNCAVILLFTDKQPVVTDLVIEVKSGSISHSETLAAGR